MTRRTRLFLVALESREVPGGLDHVPFFADDPTGAAANRGRNAPPVISDFRAIVGPNGQVTFKGRVSDDTPVLGYVVHITGPGIDVAAIVLRDGTFSVTTVVSGPSEVTVSAQTTDSSGANSDPVSTTFQPS
jgi:hypothetical protein